MSDYRYELRHGDTVIATGHITHELPLEIGEQITIGRHHGIVRTIQPLSGEHELHLVVQLRNDN